MNDLPAGWHVFKIGTADWSVDYPAVPGWVFTNARVYPLGAGHATRFTFDTNVHADIWQPETNIIWVNVTGQLASRLVPALAEKGVLATGTKRVRFVTHLDVSAADIATTLATVRAIVDD